MSANQHEYTFRRKKSCIYSNKSLSLPLPSFQKQDGGGNVENDSSKPPASVDAPVEVASPAFEAVEKKIGEQGDKIRQMKSSGADKVGGQDLFICSSFLS